ncbi:hypothetical protein SKAU_G00427720 [Synaphobranchus kaupii]|uniref:Uncharacterized protein n=1 Tax=Synaphobranchus kaupii TaxID=118154 RepID=A0A9Q1E4R4_SYNKA|nr:hypothetical protein SKAU_G00427720 [Synaphobranchus kaupii]
MWESGVFCRGRAVGFRIVGSPPDVFLSFPRLTPYRVAVARLWPGPGFRRGGPSAEEDVEGGVSFCLSFHASFHQGKASPIQGKSLHPIS